MSRTGWLRHGVPVAAGGALFLLCAFAAGLDWLPSALVGGLTWAALAAFLYRPDPFRALRRNRGLGIDPDVIRTELAAAGERIARLREAAMRIDRPELAVPLREIADAAETISADVVADPRDYPRLRRLLVYQLDHAAEVAEGLAALPADRIGATPALARAHETLPQVADSFRRHRDRLFDNETFDVDTRLTLLENDLARLPVSRGSSTPRR